MFWLFRRNPSKLEVRWDGGWGGSKHTNDAAAGMQVQSAAAVGPEEPRLDGGDVLVWKKIGLCWLWGEEKSWLRFIWLEAVPIGDIS